MRPRVKVTSAMMITMVVVSVVMSVVVSVGMSMGMSVPTWTPATPFEAMRVSHHDVFNILLDGHIVWSFQRRLVVIHRETKETTWPLAATEGTNVLLVLFL
jgi:hypothetical protein